MVHIGIFENEDFALSRSVLKLTNCALTTNPTGGSLDILLISSSFKKQFPEISSDIVIVPDCLNRSSLSSISANSLISYGLCTKNTVTASSLIRSKLAISLQRKISDIDGGILEEQELIVNIKNGEFAEEALGVVSLLLTLGIPSEHICRLKLSF